MRRLRLSFRFGNRLGLLPLAVMAGLGFADTTAWAQPTNDNFLNAAPISGQWGSILGRNIGATAEPGEPSHGGFPASASIWYKWTAPFTGEVALDTLGSTNATGFNLDTVLAVYSGPDISHLTQVAANDDLYPFQHEVENALPLPIAAFPPANNGWVVEPTAYFLPYSGPSGLRFNAVGGTTYYVAVDTKVARGNIALSWAFFSSGAFRFATEDFDMFTTVTPTPIFQCSENESSLGFQNETTFHTYYTFDPLGVEVTVTRVAGSTGRMWVDYTTGDGTARSNLDYVAVSGTLVFDDFDMSKTLVIPIIPPILGVGLPAGSTIDRYFSVILSNPRRDPLESLNVSPPRLDPPFAKARVIILSSTNPQTDPDQYPNGQTAPSHDVFNFWRKHYYVPEDVNDYWTSVAINVVRTSIQNPNGDGATINYRIDNTILETVEAPTVDNLFPLTPGSDYAIPNPNTTLIREGTNFDFTIAQGSITFGGNTTWVPITFTVTNDTLTKFNRDFHIVLYRDNRGPRTIGEINDCFVTIFFNDQNPPAGSIDQTFSPDFSTEMKPPIGVPNRANPGADGTVYDLVVQPDGRTILAGQFGSFNSASRKGIARINADGSIDTTFNPLGGADGFVSSLDLQSDGRIVIGGAFTFFNGTQVNSIARLNIDGTLDNSFTAQTGVGADGAVWAVTLQPDGRILIGGEFTHFNSVPRSHIARLNTDGSLDTSFDPSTNAPNGTVNSIVLTATGQIVAGGQFSMVGSQNLRNLVRLNADGTLDNAFAANLVSGVGIGVQDAVYALAVQADGKLLVGGEFTNVDVIPASRLARLLPNGVPDTSFNAGSGADDTVYSMSPGTNGTVYAGGLFTKINGTHRLGYARLFPDGTVDTSFMDSSYNQFAGLHRKYFDFGPKPFVYSSQVLPDGNVMIGGGFSQVGGGQANFHSRVDANYPATALNNTNVWIEPKSRDGVRNRLNIAKLIGGATPGPGNVSLLYSNYAVARSQSSIDVSLLRTNGSLGYMSANFAFLPGQAQSGVDYIYNSTPPLYLSTWNLYLLGFNSDAPRSETRKHDDGLAGTNSVPVDIFGHYWFGYDPGRITVSTRNSSVPGDTSTSVKLSNPSGADSFYLGGQNIPVGGALGRSVAPFTFIDDNRNGGVIGFASAQYTVNENGTNALITLTRTNGSAGSVTVRYTTLDGTAVAGSNYTAVAGSLTFVAGQTTQYFTVPIRQDGFSEPNGMSVNLQLYFSGIPTGGSLGLTNAILNIIDSDNSPGYINFSSATYTTNQTSGAAILTVTRTGSAKGTVSIQCNTTNGTAVAGVKYVGSTTNFLWNDTDSSPRYFVVPLIDNGLAGPNTTFGAFLSNPQVNLTNNFSIVSGSPTRATVTIIDDNLFGSPQFSAPSYLVNENGGYATVTVIRTNGSAQSISVNYATSDGTAVASGTLPNYVATSGTLTFNPGEVAKSFNVPILDDGAVDPANFFFNVNLSGLTPPGASYGYQTSARVFIKDAESFNQPAGSPDISFAPNPGLDGDVFGIGLQTNGQIVVVGSFAHANSYPRAGIARYNADSTIDSSFLNGLSGANAPINSVLVQSDGRILAGGGFTFMNGVSRNRLVRLLADGTIDSSFTGGGADSSVFALAETFMPDRRLLVGGSFVSMNGAQRQGLARLNNDGTLDLGFNQALTVNGTVYAIAVYPTNTIQAGKILIGGSFTSVNGQTYNRLARLNPDGTLDTIFNPGGAGASDIVRAIAIQLDGRVLIGGAFTNFNNIASSRMARLTVNGAVDTSFNIGPGADDTVAAIALQQDTRIVVGGQFTHANGVARSRITRLLPDGTVDPSINFGLGADNFINAVAIQPDSMLVVGGGFSQFDGLPRPHLARLYGGSIVGSGGFEFTTGTYAVDEDATNALITIRRRGGTAGNVSVTFRTTDNTAVAGVNYSNVSSTVYFPVGETVRIIPIPVRQDFQITPDLVVNLALSNPLPPAGLGNQPIATLTIFNDDCSVSFGVDAYRVNENVFGGVETFNVTRQGSVRRPATVDFMTTTNGTAVPGFNYTPTTNTLTFSPGFSNAPVSIPILPTIGLAEGDVTVSMLLTNANHALLFAPNQATLTIVDVDQAPGLFFFSQTNYVVGEADGQALITVLRTNGHSGVVNLNFNTVAGSATPGIKYGPTNFLLSFQDGETAKSVAIPILEENQVEGNETFFVTLSNPGGSTTNILGPAVVPVTIIDDDIGVGFSSPIYISTETDPSVTLVVNRVGTNGTTSVSYATTNGTAIAGTNYIPTSGTLVFGPGESVKTFSLSLLHDPRVTGPLSFNVSLFGATAPAQIFTNNPTTVTINDADPGLAFTNANFYTVKSATNVLISVLRSNANTGLVSVNYSTLEGTALAGVDFIPMNGLLTFSNGIALQSFNVGLINNQQVGPDRTFSVNIFNPTGSGQVLEPSTASVTITNDLAGISFSSPSYKVNENGVQALITVLRTGYTNSSVSVDYFTADGSGLAGVNYSNVSGALTFTNGETAKTFAVPVIDDSLVTGDKTVLLGLRNAFGHVVLVNPSASILTIVETDGSLVVPAGTALISESGPVNNSIDPGETVSLLFAFRNSAGTNTVNLVAKLLATNGIANPSAPQTYGVLVVHGPAVSRPFTFTANATNGQVIQATFQLTDGNAATNFGVVTFVVGQTTALYSNTASIVINDNTKASPYPSTISVSALPGLVSKAVVTLTNLNHDSPRDIDALLVSPAGQKSLIMSRCGADITVNQVSLTFDDAAGTFLPQFTQLTSGTYRPTSFAVATPPFPPALTPPPPYTTNLSTFSGFNPNGNWSLYIIDDSAPYSGIISNGWRLQLTTGTPVAGNADLALGMTGTPNPVIATSNLSVTLNLTNFGPSAASNIVVTDTFPPGAGYVSSSPSLGTTATNGAGQLLWSVASLTNGGTANLTFVVRPPAVGFVTNSAVVSNSIVDLNPDDDSASVVVLVTAPIADLSVDLVGAPNPVLSGNNLIYTITITNLGPATATSVSLTDTLPPGVNFVSASPPGYAVSSGVVTFANLGDVGSGGQLSATIVVNPAVGGTLTNSVTTASSIPDPLKLNNSASIKTVVIPVVVSISQSGNSIIISWPSAATGYYLESTTNLHPPAVWTPVTVPQPVDIGGQQTVTLPVGSGTEYFRVHGQAQ